MTSKILIIADRPNWAYHEIQKFILKAFKSKYKVYTDFVSLHKKNSDALNFFTRLKIFIVHIIWRLKYQNLASNNKYDLVIYLGYYFEEQMKVSFTSRYKALGIYTDGFPPACCTIKNPSQEEFSKFYFKQVDAVVCGSLMIRNYYRNFLENVFYANASLDKNLFLKEKELNVNKTGLRIGWTGNPSREFKHYYDVILPAIEKSKKLREGIEYYSRFSGPLKTLPNFYEDLDIVLIASDKDAGPSMFMEAALMNVPSISTKIGWPNEVIEHEKNGLFVNGDIDSFVEAILFLYDNKDKLLTMKKRIREDCIRIIGEDESIKRWQALFNHFQLK